MQQEMRGTGCRGPILGGITCEQWGAVADWRRIRADLALERGSGGHTEEGSAGGGPDRRPWQALESNTLRTDESSRGRKGEEEGDE